MDKTTTTGTVDTSGGGDGFDTGPDISSTYEFVALEKIPFQWDKTRVFNSLVFPIIQQYYNNLINNTAIDLINRNVVKAWWETNNAEIRDTVFKISDSIRVQNKAKYDNTGAVTLTDKGNIWYAPGGSTAVDVWSDEFFTYIFNPWNKNHRVLEYLGLTNWLQEQGGLGLENSTIEGLESANAKELAKLEWYKNLVENVFGGDTDKTQKKN